MTWALCFSSRDVDAFWPPLQSHVTWRRAFFIFFPDFCVRFLRVVCAGSERAARSRVRVNDVGTLHLRRALRSVMASILSDFTSNSVGAGRIPDFSQFFACALIFAFRVYMSARDLSARAAIAMHAHMSMHMRARGPSDLARALCIFQRCSCHSAPRPGTVNINFRLYFCCSCTLQASRSTCTYIVKQLIFIIN